MEEILEQIKPCEFEFAGECFYHPTWCFCEAFIRQEKERLEHLKLKNKQDENSI